MRRNWRAYYIDLVIVALVTLGASYAATSLWHRFQPSHPEYPEYRRYADSCREQEGGTPFLSGDTLICVKGVVWVRPRDCPFCDQAATKANAARDLASAAPAERSGK